MQEQNLIGLEVKKLYTIDFSSVRCDNCQLLIHTSSELNDLDFEIDVKINSSERKESLEGSLCSLHFIPFEDYRRIPRNYRISAVPKSGRLEIFINGSHPKGIFSLKFIGGVATIRES
jgi:hypothetical protein